jgi:Zn-dependent protease with chaperone function
MDVSVSLTLVLFNLAAYALGFGMGTGLAEMLAGPWRRAAGTHWTERARLAHAPGAAVIWLAALLPSAIAILTGVGLEILHPSHSASVLGFWMPWLAAFAGVLTARYRWLRELWGARVTVRSWLAGCLVLAVLLIPHLLVMLLLLVLLPDTPSPSAAAAVGAGFLAVAFFVSGGGLRLLRLLCVARPAAPHLAAMVEQLAQEMELSGRVRVLELEWALVNAVASVTYRAVGFSRALLEVMSPAKIRAVAAHELAHLLEPGWVRIVRVIHTFAYLPVVLLIKYGGNGGALAGWLLMVTIMLGFRRFTRHMEVRADRLESQAVAAPEAYMRSMIKLHEANMVPAVMPGAQSHPHLYDRLLAGGIQPDFPRPQAPSRAKPVLAALTATLVAAAVMFSLIVALSLTHRDNVPSRSEIHARLFAPGRQPPSLPALPAEGDCRKSRTA